MRMEWLYERFGLKSLLFCKFVPGFSTVAPTLAGALRAPRWRPARKEKVKNGLYRRGVRNNSPTGRDPPSSEG